MKYILILSLVFSFSSCGTKSTEDDSPTCKDFQYQGQCSKYRMSQEGLPAYAGCKAAYKYNVSGKGTGTLAVMSERPNQTIINWDQWLVLLRVQLLVEGKVDQGVEVDMRYSRYSGYFDTRDMAYFELKEGKEYTVTCDASYRYKNDPSVYVVGASSIKTTLNPGVDSNRPYYGCLLNFESEKQVSVSFLWELNGSKIESVIIKRNGQQLAELKDASTSYLDESPREAGKEYKYTCDAVAGGKTYEGAHSVTVKKN